MQRGIGLSHCIDWGLRHFHVVATLSSKVVQGKRRVLTLCSHGVPAVIRQCL